MVEISSFQTQHVVGGSTVMEGILGFIDQLSISVQTYKDSRDEKNKEDNIGI